MVRDIGWKGYSVKPKTAKITFSRFFYFKKLQKHIEI